MPRPIKPKEDALFVEGPDDMSVINELVKALLNLDISAGTQLVRKPPTSGGGVDRAVDQFGKYLVERKPASRVGLVIDRDGLEGRPDNQARVQDLAKRHGLSFVQEAGGGFAAKLGDGGRVGIWKWPDNQTEGDLEHFVAGLVAPKPVWDYARAASREAKESHEAEFGESERRKVELKVRSVWIGESGGGYGHIIRKGLADLKSPAVVRFTEWFRWVFLED
jgi:hypothetical protein